MIKAPFNFVPLSEKAYLPEWGDYVSLDVPFKDAVSGTISLKITAESPIFIRNGHSKREQDCKDNAYLSFSKNPQGEYFIPGSSLKGAVRSVFEIMTFGKMTQVDDSHFGKRDLDNKEYRKMLSVNKVHCGWLSYDGKSYLLDDCGKPSRISIEELDTVISDTFNLKTDLWGYAKNQDNFKNGNGRESVNKYRIILEALHKSANKEDIEKLLLDSDDYLLSDGDCTLVLTGQSGVREYRKNTDKPIPSKNDIDDYCRKKGLPLPTSEKEYGEYRKKIKITGCWTGKGKEFLFPNKVIATRNVDNIIDAFKTIHADSPDYVNLWSKKLASGKHRVPVFFVLNGDQVHSMGLSFLYKYPYKLSVHGAIPSGLKDLEEGEGKVVKMDMAERIFGTIKNDGLKGRVQFCHSIPKRQEEKESVELALNSPKPSYYPLYKRGDDWDRDTNIAGRKQYLHLERPVYRKSEDNPKINSKIIPLREQSWFESEVHFFNLKPVELGALLSAITFLGDNGKHFKYAMGQGKPYGFGICSVEAKKVTLVNEDNGKTCEIGFSQQCDYMKAFVNEMNACKEKLQISSWEDSEQIRTLFAIASSKEKVSGNDVYMSMSMDRNNNQFFLAKKEHLYLKKYDCAKVELPNLDTLAKEYEEKKAIEDELKAEQLRLDAMRAVAEEQMKCLQLGDKVTVSYQGGKKALVVAPVQIEMPIQLVIPKGETEPTINQIIEVYVGQVSKTGKIVQLKMHS